MSVKKLTPVLFGEEVESCVRFWVERMGFQKTVDLPQDNKLAFAMLQKANVERMYQSYSSADKGGVLSQAVGKGPSFVYVEVDSLAGTIAAIQGAEVVMSVRPTLYGSTEIGIKDPGGHVVTFAQFGCSEAGKYAPRAWRDHLESASGEWSPLPRQRRCGPAYGGSVRLSSNSPGRLSESN